MSSLQNALVALEAWLAEYAPPLLPLLNAAADPVDISTFEAESGLRLTPQARALYMTYDGEADGSDGIFGCRRWLPLKEVSREVSLIGSEGVIPLLRSGGGDLLYVKSYTPTAPDERVYEWWHEQPDLTEVVAESLEAFVTGFVADLQAGRYVYRPDELAALIDRREIGEG